MAGCDGWKSGESKTGAPGERAAMSNSPSPASGLKAETRRDDTAKMTGPISKPEPEKGSLRTTVVTIGVKREPEFDASKVKGKA